VTKPLAPLDLETLAVQLAELKARLDALPPPEQDAYKIKEFCKRHKMSVSTFHKLRKEGRGPDLIWPGAQCLVTKEAAAEWRTKKMPADGKSNKEKLAQARRNTAAKIAAQSPNHGGQKRKKKGKSDDDDPTLKGTDKKTSSGET
jgi:hypothetical protein